MALPRGLTGTRLDDYLDMMRQSHEIRIQLEVLNADDELVVRYDEHDLPIIDGQVDVDLDSAIHRQLRITLANTDEATTDPSDPRSALSAKRQLRVLYGVLVNFSDGTSDWVYTPVFYGPITRVERDAETVQLEAQSKEAFMLPPSKLQRSAVPNEDGEQDNKISTYYAGDLIKKIARRHGERMFRVPRTNRKLPEDAKLFDKATQETGAWPLLQRIAGAQQLFYTADGWLTLRTHRTNSAVYVFNDGNNGEVLSVPKVEWDMTVFRNTLELRAFQKKQGNEKENPTLRVIAKLEGQHPLSARSLARHGEPRQLIEVVSTDDVYANATIALKDAETLLDRKAALALNVQFDCLPVPFLEPGDLVALDLEGEPRRKFAVKKFSLPLTPASMSLGYNRRVGRRR